MLLSVMLSSTLAIVPQRQPQQLRPSPAALARAADAQAPPPFNATSSSTWLTQMSDQVHHALVEAKKLEQRVAAATTAASHDDANINATAGVQGNTLLREVTFKPGMMDAGLQTFRRSMLLHELATTCRLVVVLDDPDPSSRDAAFLSMWQLDGKSEPAQPVHANGGDGYRKLRVALSGLAWQKHDRAHTAYAKRFYEGRVDAGFYSTKWFWLKASHDKQAWLNFDQISNSSRMAAAPPPSLAMSPPPSPMSPPLRFTPPSSPLADESLPEGAASLLEEAEGDGDAEELAVTAAEGQAEAADGQAAQEAGQEAEEGEQAAALSEAGTPEAEAEAEAGGEAVAEAAEAEAEEGGAAAEAAPVAVPVAVAAEGEHRGFPSLPAPSLSLSSGSNSGALGNGTRQRNATVHVERRGLEEEPPAASPPVLGMQGLVCYKIIALFKQGGLEQGRASLLDALLPEVAPLPEAVAATALHDTELQKMLVLVLAKTPLNMSRLAASVQSSQQLGPLLSEPLVTETYADAAIYWPGAL